MATQKVMIVLGSVIATVGFIFFGALILLSIFGHTVPCQQRYLVIIFLSIMLGFSASVMAGNLTVDGKLNIPLAKDNPLTFSAASGFAIFIFLFVVGQQFYIERANCDETPNHSNEETAANYLTETKTIDQHWIEASNNNFYCSKLKEDIPRLLEKLRDTQTDSLSLKTNINRFHKLARLEYYKTTISSESQLWMDWLNNATGFLEQATELTKKLKTESNKYKEDYDWYISNRFGAAILSTKIFIDAKKYIITHDKKYLESAKKNYSDLMADNSDLLKNESTPVEQSYWDLIKSDGSSDFKIKDVCF